MKTFIHIITHHWKILAFAFLAIGCSDYLGESPDNRIQLTEIEDYKALVTNAYPGAYHLFTEIMTDNYKYYDYPGTNNITIVEWFKPMYIWSDKYMQILAVGPARAWEYYYGEIYKTNEVLKGIDNAEGKDEELRNQVKGEALLLRAYCHFMLVNLFGKQYNASTAATDLGVPYTTKPQEDNVAEYPRDNIKDVYDWIERDALEGVALLVDKKVNVPKYHFTKASAYAFLCRFYQFKEDWDNSIKYGEMSQTLNSTVREFVNDYNATFAKGDYDEFANSYCSINKPNILLMNKVLEFNSYTTNGYYSNEFWATAYETNDYRNKIHNRYYPTTPIYKCRKFRNVSNGGYRYSDVALFTTEEVMLNLAEAYTRKTEPDHEKAISLLNKIREKRFVPYTPLTSAALSLEGELGKVLLAKVLHERRVELCYEGYRWFDCKRFQIEIKHTTETGTYVLKGNDLRYVLQIPDAELSANPAMVPNPR
ncbi:RagB/SusD family nutrient uptake outer membrane protein [Culturomica massiliensis]|uniref:RagB/SusD family nutrient uptake outer membrane protein n=1 Tax=Culturomica massiliensis TaxID=1841857 RepID=UPI000A4A9C9E|nr:RagB/SusD family nutrient uptake outer membrane protein [Culturomica massiliensis]